MANIRPRGSCLLQCSRNSSTDRVLSSSSERPAKVFLGFLAGTSRAFGFSSDRSGGRGRFTGVDDVVLDDAGDVLDDVLDDVDMLDGQARKD